MASSRTFDIGIALAGGSTRGSYSAGAMDFLLQALHEWETERKKDPADRQQTLPPWNIRLKTLAGTSAGGITAAVVAGSLCTPFEPLSNSMHVARSLPNNNNLYKIWVEQASIENLFSCDDINISEARKNTNEQITIKSILSSTFQDNQSGNALYAQHTNGERPSWAEELEIYFTTSNLRGVPYSIDKFASADRELHEFRMTRHRDWIGFTTSNSGPKGLYSLDLHSSRDIGSWKHMKTAAQATAALPLFFPTRTISIPTELYEHRIQGERPDWPENMPNTYHYDAVDGGVFLNEPLQLVRSSMEYGRQEKVICEDASCTRGAMILLHPSPKRDTYKADFEVPDYWNMFSSVQRLFGALMDDANFQEDELKEMTDTENASRFMLTPVRDGKRAGEDVLGTDAMNGFGGIIDKEVRLHDYQLGRKNCQDFLQNLFVMPIEAARKNKIFGEEANAFAVATEDSRQVVPIIPLVGTAKDPCPHPKWPKFNDRKKAQILERTDRVIRFRVHTIFTGVAHNMGFYKSQFAFGMSRIWNFVVNHLVNKATNIVMQKANGSAQIALKQFS